MDSHDDNHVEKPQAAGLVDPLDVGIMQLRGLRLLIRLRDKAPQIMNAQIGEEVHAFAVEMPVDIEVAENGARLIVPGLWELRVTMSDSRGRDVTMNYCIRTADILSVRTAALVAL